MSGDWADERAREWLLKNGGPLSGPGVPDEYGWVPIAQWSEASLAALLREVAAIDAGSHPVLIHEGLEALDRLREQNARLKGQTCERCGGRGVRVYPDTTTWIGGIGGQMMTESTCDKCWGTGRLDVAGPNLRVIYAKISKAENDRDNAARERDEARAVRARIV